MIKFIRFVKLFNKKQVCSFPKLFMIADIIKKIVLPKLNSFFLSSKIQDLHYRYCIDCMDLML